MKETKYFSVFKNSVKELDDALMFLNQQISQFKKDNHSYIGTIESETLHVTTWGANNLALIIIIQLTYYPITTN